MKLQINVSDEFGEFTDKLVEACKKKQHEDAPGLEQLAPRSANQLIPLALVRVAKDIGCDVPQSITDEAKMALVRKPGPKKKDDRQLSFVDGKPGLWASLEQLRSASLVVHGKHTLPVVMAKNMSTIDTQCAVAHGWGIIPEDQNGVPGIRFIPPDTSLIPDPPKPPKPNVTEVGTFVSEARIQEGAIAILADGRIVPRIENDKLGESVIRFKHATLTESESELPDETKNGILSQRTRESFRIAGADAVEIGWTVRRETRRGVRGFRYIPPGTKLRFILPEQEVDMG